MFDKQMKSFSQRKLQEFIKADADRKDYSVTMCEYDKSYAKEHNANKLLSFMLRLLMYFVPFFVYFLIFLLDAANDYLFLNISRTLFHSDILFDIIAFFPLYYAFILLILVNLAEARFKPFLQAGKTVWYVVRDVESIDFIRVIYRPFVRSWVSNVLYSPKAAEKKSDSWILEYEKSNGKHKKHTVPRAFPKLDTILEESLEKGENILPEITENK